MDPTPELSTPETIQQRSGYQSLQPVKRPEIRRYAYQLPDHYPSHWLLKMLGDRVDSWSYHTRRALPVLIPAVVIGYLCARGRH